MLLFTPAVTLGRAPESFLQLADLLVRRNGGLQQLDHLRVAFPVLPRGAGWFYEPKFDGSPDT